MNANVDFDLSSTQWETLKALRNAASEHRDLHHFALQELIAFELAALSGGRPMLTPKGREVVLRGSPRLWDVAA
jgi:hypothetical protein